MEDNLSCLGAAAATGDNLSCLGAAAAAGDNLSCLCAPSAGSKAMFPDNSPETASSVTSSQSTENSCDSCSEHKVIKYSDLFRQI